MDSNMQALDGFLKGRVLIVGIGNQFRGDDGAGPALIKSLESKVQSRRGDPRGRPGWRLHLMDVGEVPENYLDRITGTGAERILFVDAADFGAAAGSMRLINVDDLDERGFSTHTSSLKLVIDYLMRQIKAEIFLLGIQPESLKMGAGLSKPVVEALEKIEECVLRCMS